MTDFLQALATIEQQITAACVQANRARSTVTLTAVSKTQPDEMLVAALDAGLRVFGENRVQEAEAHWAKRRAAYPDLELRLIGPLQTNKVPEAVALFDVIETVDREKLAAAIAKECARRKVTTRCLIQVNTGEEPQKAGIAPTEAAAFVQHCRTTHGLAIEGLMCIPPVDEPVAPHFAFLAKLAAECGLSVLSMGMSGDFGDAIRLGATHVRIGSALFGARA